LGGGTQFIKKDGKNKTGKRPPRKRTGEALNGKADSACSGARGGGKEEDGVKQPWG